MIRTADNKNWGLPLNKFRYATWTARLDSSDKALFDLGYQYIHVPQNRWHDLRTNLNEFFKKKLKSDREICNNEMFGGVGNCFFPMNCKIVKN